MKIFRLSLLAIAFLSVAVPASAQYFPDIGREAVHQRALDGRSRLNVLSIALEPGYEDLAALAYFRMGVGARIVSAYVTNGEAGESDVRGEYPNQLAAVRRTEAARALNMLGGEEFFLNMPDFGAAVDTATVRDQWPIDSLRQRLSKLIVDLRPDVILIARDWATGGTSPRLEVLRAELLRAVQRLEPTAAQKKAGGADELYRWNVDRILQETGSKTGIRVASDRVHPLWKKSYGSIGDEAASAYESLIVQRKQWYSLAPSGPVISYEQSYPRRGKPRRALDDELPPPAPANLKGIDAEIVRIAAALQGGRISGSSKVDALKRVTAVLDSVDALLSDPLELSSQGRKIALQWKLSLENLRVALLGVAVRHSEDYRILAERQLMILTIDTVLGVRPSDSLRLYLPMYDQGWFINDIRDKIQPLVQKKQNNFLSPAKLEYDLPASLDGLSRSTIGKTVTFFVLRQGKGREENFIDRVSLRLLYSPKFTVEVLTPIVRAVNSERVIVRLTNHSRDGVRDSVHVIDSLAFAPKVQFGLSQKDLSQVDTLILTWKRPLEEGTYLIPVNIAEQQVGRFATRAFEADIDKNRQVALITGLAESPTAGALRRLGVSFKEFYDAGSLAKGLGAFPTAILDRRALTLIANLRTQLPILVDYVERGGHLIILAQDAKTWNASPLVDGLNLTSSNAWEEAFAVEADSSHRLLSTPNPIREKDWTGWLYRRASNILSGPALASAVVPLRSRDDKNPLIAEWKMGTGLLTYVDLALSHQFLNVHPGAFRLLANIISY